MVEGRSKVHGAARRCTGPAATDRSFVQNFSSKSDLQLPSGERESLRLPPRRPWTLRCKLRSDCPGARRSFRDLRVFHKEEAEVSGKAKERGMGRRGRMLVQLGLLRALRVGATGEHPDPARP